jgi:hypothetical protein
MQFYHYEHDGSIADVTVPLAYLVELNGVLQSLSSEQKDCRCVVVRVIRGLRCASSLRFRRPAKHEGRSAVMYVQVYGKIW